MDARKFEEAMNAMASPDNESIQQASAILMDYLEKPQSIFFLFNIFENPSSDYIKKTSIILLRKAIQSNYHALDPQVQNQIIDKLINLAFSPVEFDYNEMETTILYEILCQCVEKNTIQINTLINLIISSFPVDLFRSNYLLSKIIPNIDKDSPILLENKKEFFDFSLKGMQSNEKPYIQSIKLYFCLKEKNLSVEDEPHLDIIIQNAQMTEYLDFYSEYWEVLSEAVSKHLIQKEKIIEIFNIILQTDQIMEDAANYASYPVTFLINSFDYLETSQILQVLDIICKLYINIFINEGDFPTWLVDNLSKSFKKTKNIDFKCIFKLEIDKFSRLEADIDITSLISIYFIIAYAFPSTFSSYIDEFTSVVKLAIDKNVELLNILACIVLNKAQQTNQFNDTLAIEFLPKILNFITVDNSQLQNEAFNVIDLFLDCIGVTFPWLFRVLWLIKDKMLLFGETQQNYFLLLAKAIEKDENINSNQLKPITDFILSQPNSIDLLPLSVAVMIKDEKYIDVLFTNSFMGYLQNPFNMDLNQSILTFFEEFSVKLREKLQPIVENFQKHILNRKTNDFDQLNICCIFAKQTNNQKSVKVLGKLLIEKLMNYNDYHFNFSTLLNSCECIIKLLDRKTSKQMLFRFYLLIIQKINLHKLASILKPIKKLLHYSCEEDKDFYISKCNDIFDKIVTGSLKCVQGKDIFSDEDCICLMDEFGSFCIEFVRHQSPFVEKVCNFIIKVIKTCPNSSFFITYIGACYDIFEYKTGSQKVNQEIIDLIPYMIQSAKYESVKQNIAFMFVSIAHYDEKSLKSIIQYAPVLQNWFYNEKEIKYVHKSMVSTIALAFLALFANGMKIDADLLGETINEFPPVEYKDTTEMIESIISIFNKNEIEASIVQKAALALSRLFLLDENKLKMRKVPKEVMEDARKLFITFSKTNSKIMQIINDEYKDSKDKITKLQVLLQE